MIRRDEVESIARELGAFLIYLDKGAIEAQHMDLVTFAMAVEIHTRRMVLRDVDALFSQSEEQPSNSDILDMIRYGELV